MTSQGSSLLVLVQTSRQLGQKAMPFSLDLRVLCRKSGGKRQREMQTSICLLY